MAELPQTIPGVVRRAAEKFGALEGVVDGDVRLTFAELAAQVDIAARALIASGVEPGDRVAIWAPNVFEWAVVALGTHSVGGVVIPLNTRFKGAEAGYVLRAAGARRLFTVTDFLDTNYVSLLQDAGVLDELDDIVILRGAVPDGCTPWADFLQRGRAVTADEAAARAEAVQPDDLSDILFTSGTTGAPKGAMLMHSASIRAFEAWSDVVGLR
jgi:long-subunit acyl-CoA synthetase (AMP-forming)